MRPVVTFLLCESRPSQGRARSTQANVLALSFFKFAHCGHLDHADVMAALNAHVKRRNDIAHRGDTVSGEDARASLAAVLAVTQLVHELSYRKVGLEDVLEEEARERGDVVDEDDEDNWQECRAASAPTARPRAVDRASRRSRWAERPPA